jgi:hypothetical protein
MNQAETTLAYQSYIIYQSLGMSYEWSRKFSLAIFTVMTDVSQVRQEGKRARGEASDNLEFGRCPSQCGILPARVQSL